MNLRRKKLSNLSRLYNFKKAGPGFECKIDAPKPGTLLPSLVREIRAKYSVKSLEVTSALLQELRKAPQNDEFELGFKI